MSSPLHQLCERYGVLSGYTDTWGQTHHTSDVARRALLAAMEVAAATEQQVLDSLQACERSRWLSPLPPVLVVREHERPFRVEVVIAAQHETQPWRWSLRRESGWEDRGEFWPGALAGIERGSCDGQTLVRRQLCLDLALETGYHRLVLEHGADVRAEMVFIVAPASAYQPPVISAGKRAWGLAAQLYALRSTRNWGMGDFGDLGRLLESAAGMGAATVLLNPLHALFPGAPEHASPYSPSSRSWLNTLYLDIEAMADFAECPQIAAEVREFDFQARLCALRAAPQVDYPAVATLKSGLLARLYAHFRAAHLAHHSERARAFRAFQAERGAALRGQALFEALQAHFQAQDATVWGWPAWPSAYHDPDSPAVHAFCAENAEAVEFHEYLQWQAALQLETAGRRSLQLGLGIGIMLDLAIGVAEGGAATWMQRALHALGASAGAPPDEINRQGQDWGLPPWIPHRLRAAAYAPFIELLRTSMREAGALRIDHVMGLRRLFWVARGLPVAEGAYVSYPFADLLGILALESQRNRCMVIGEDLGTVPDEVRHALQPAKVMSTRLLYFERDHAGQLKSPADYPVQAMAAITTHDLPTLAGFWQEVDLELRTQLQLFPDEALRARLLAERAADRRALFAALQAAGLLAGADGPPSQLTPELAAAIHAWLARAPSSLLLVPTEDALGVCEQPNLPGTVAPVYPCWRLKLPLNLEDWPSSPWLRAIVPVLRAQRPS